ncbi:MAG: SUMF1/EgtB/PvdO family nonheme iron enzyme [Deltaproteobacteria bacterium]|nr:SUMF1/EgtB/PvdO family nonheme iron enzyme [Deltaproteobacteria bacterium]
MCLGTLALACLLAPAFAPAAGPEGTPAAQAPPGLLVVMTRPNGLEVTLDRKAAGPAPFEVELAPGAHAVSVTHQGRTTEETAEVPAGQRTTFIVDAAGGSVTVRREEIRPAPTVYLEPVTGMELILVAGGTFEMGDTFGDGERDEQPVHQVTVSAFYLGKQEVTNAQFRKFRPDHDSGAYEGRSLNGDDRPAVKVSWDDAVAFARWLSEKTGGAYRLPTEAEWEYAARAGTEGRNYWGDKKPDACRHANVHDETSQRINERLTWEAHECDDGYAITAPVGTFQPNAFGFYDLIGKVWEWCQDGYAEKYYGESPQADALAAPAGDRRVLRGGAWSNRPRKARVADRDWSGPGDRSINVGFRLGLSAPP